MLALSDAFDSAMQNYVIPKTPVFDTDKSINQKPAKSRHNYSQNLSQKQSVNTCPSFSF